MVARGLYDAVPNRPFHILVANWSKKAMTLPKNMTIAQSTASPNTIWPTPAQGDSINMTRLYKEAETKEEKLFEIMQ